MHHPLYQTIFKSPYSWTDVAYGIGTRPEYLLPLLKGEKKMSERMEERILRFLRNHPYSSIETRTAVHPTDPCYKTNNDHDPDLLKRMQELDREINKAKINRYNSPDIFTNKNQNHGIKT
mgnify:CR=1 FL=1